MQTDKNLQNQRSHHTFSYDSLFDSFPITAHSVKPIEGEWGGDTNHFDAILELSYAGRSATFAVNYKQRVDERTFCPVIGTFGRLGDPTVSHANRRY